MDIIDIENKREELKKVLNVSSSQREKVLLIADYYASLLNSDNEKLIESYIIEFIEIFINCLNGYYTFGIKPNITEKLIEVSEKLIKLNFLKEFKPELADSVEGIKLNYNELLNSLEGEIYRTVESEKQYIPVLEEAISSGNIKLGLLESITVSLKKTKDIGKFVIVPSGKELEKRLIDQVKTSWKVALNYSSNYLRKKIDNLDVIVSFDKRFGYYTGNSLGTALTIIFLEELLKFYNSPIIINKRNVTAITGGIDEYGNILSVTNEIIRQKMGVVFYSNVNLFVISKQDETDANNELSYLKSKYPKRKLNIESIENFDDLLNRRNIVDIKKQKAIVRSAKFALKNWAAVLFLAMVLILVYVGRFYDFDDNPAILVNKGYWLSVQNKNGKELWKKRMGFSSYINLDKELVHVTQKIIDVDDDGTNEVILARDDYLQYRPSKQSGRVACFSSDGEQIWEYYFRDTIASIEMNHSSQYESFIIDTITFNKTKVIACSANNVLYPSAIYFLDVKTGERIDTTMWHVGHLHSGIFKDLNQDGKLELIMAGLNNSLGRVVIFSIDVDKIGGQLPAIGDRMFEELTVAEVNNYAVLPKSDYTRYFGLKFNHDSWGAVNNYFGKNNIHIFLYEGPFPDYKGIMVDLNNDLSVNKFDISEDFQVARDALVESGELQQPYSHTKEYLNILFEQIRFWDGTKFVTEEENYKRVLSGKIMK